MARNNRFRFQAAELLKELTVQSEQSVFRIIQYKKTNNSRLCYERQI